MAMPRRTDVDDFYDHLTDVQRPHLDALRSLSGEAAPDAREELKWNQPAFVRGRKDTLWYLQAFTAHCSLRFSTDFFATQKDAVEAAGRESGAGFLKLPYAEALPTELIGHLMRARVAEPVAP